MTETESVYCAVRTKYFNIVHVILGLKWYVIWSLKVLHAGITASCFLFFPDGNRQKTERYNRSGAAVPSPRGKCKDADKQR
jgi:hypothetical protein